MRSSVVIAKDLTTLHVYLTLYNFTLVVTILVRQRSIENVQDGLADLLHIHYLVNLSSYSELTNVVLLASREWVESALI